MRNVIALIAAGTLLAACGSAPGGRGSLLLSGSGSLTTGQPLKAAAGDAEAVENTAAQGAP